MILVFIISWLVFGIIAGVMVYLTPDFGRFDIVKAVVFSWLGAMAITVLVYLKKHPWEKDESEGEKKPEIDESGMKE